MKTVLLTERIGDAGLALLEARPDVQWRISPSIDPDALGREIVDANAVIVRTARVTEDILGRAPDLEVVSRHGVGCDNVAVDHLTNRGIPIAITAGANAQSVAEHTVALMLAAARRIRAQDGAVRDGDFAARHRLTATDLFGAHGLVVGFGRVGKRVAPLLKAFGMQVTVADIALDQAYADELGVEAIEDFRQVLGTADFVTLHVPLDESTRNMIDREILTQFRPGSILVNCARGGIVDEAELQWALDHGPLLAAALDVFAVEPPDVSHPLLSRSDVIVSPHTGASSHGSLHAMATMCAQNVLDCFDGVLSPDRIFNQTALETT